MTALPIASFCSADATPSETSQCYSGEQPETGEFSLPLQHHKPQHGISLSEGTEGVETPDQLSDGNSSSDEETVPLPLEPVTSKEHLPEVLPEVLEVYDKDTFRSSSYDIVGAWDSVEEILAGSPIKFKRKYPVRISRY